MDRRILVIEDDPDIARLVQLHLSDLGLRVDLAGDGPNGLERARNSGYDLILLDLMLPGMDGLEVCRALRARGEYTPILMLTARSSETDRVLGLELGGDDYLTKPFSIPELLARVKAILRRVDVLRARADEAGTAPIRVGGLELDPRTRRVVVDGRDVDLTAREFDLLVHFARSPGRVYSRAMLLDAVWGYGHDGYEHTVNSHINRLRGKIEPEPHEPTRILTVWGVGYKLRDPSEERG